MTRLILMRHAKAVPAGSMPDHERTLTGRGRRDAAAAGEALARAGWAPDRALVSDAARTRQTFEVLGAALPAAPTLEIDPSLYGAAADAILRVVTATPPGVGCLLVIGHNPGIATAALRLATAGPGEELARLRRGFPTATLAVIALPGDWAGAGEGGTLEALLVRD